MRKLNISKYTGIMASQRHLQCYHVLAFCFLLCGIVSCSRDHAGDCITRTGKEKTEKRLLGSFTKLKLFHKINYVLQRDSVNYIELRAGENILPAITSEVVNGSLTVKNGIKCKFARSYKPQINCVVHFNETIDFIQFEGSGTLTCGDTLVSPKILFECADASNSADLLLNVGTFDFRQYGGSADFKMVGDVGVFYLYAAGNGAMHCEDLHTGYTYVTSNNTSICYVNASKEIGAEAFNWGQVYYTGNPKEVQRKVKQNGIIQEIK